MPFNLSFIEPHPTVSSRTTMLSGRGGAGNYHKPLTNLTFAYDASGPASLINLTPSSTTRTIKSGRGGAGNIHHPTAPQSTSTASGQPSSSSQFSGFNSSSSSNRTGSDSHHEPEHAIFSFDEELERIKLADAPTYHVGRGGCGNGVDGGRLSDSSSRRMGAGRQGSNGSLRSRESDEVSEHGRGRKIGWVREKLGAFSSTGKQ
ncbi:hypothetical protein MMC25_003653 [Agyrium rufum]|nr:hypothetical protein [Agyrium rufum]